MFVLVIWLALSPFKVALGWLGWVSRGRSVRVFLALRGRGWAMPAFPHRAVSFQKHSSGNHFKQSHSAQRKVRTTPGTWENLSLPLIRLLFFSVSLSLVSLHLAVCFSLGVNLHIRAIVCNLCCYHIFKYIICK